MPNPSKDKGNRSEREVVALLDGAMIRGRTLTARRVPLSGAAKASGFGGDVWCGKQCPFCKGTGQEEFITAVCRHCHGTRAEQDTERKIEVKRRGQGFKRISAWMEDNFAVVFRADRGEWYICLKLSDWAEKGGKK